MPRESRPNVTEQHLLGHHHFSYASTVPIQTSITEFKLWLSKLERDSVLEFTLQKTVKPKRRRDGGFIHGFEYRGKVHGAKPYDKKHSDRERKLPARGAANCATRIYVKTYRNTPIVLGRYDATHSHSIGHDNARLTRVTEDTRVRIAELLRSGATPEAVLNVVNGLSATSDEPILGAQPSVRDTFIEFKGYTTHTGTITGAEATTRISQRSQAAIDAETRHLHKQDDYENTLLFFKSKADEPPDDSGLSRDILLLIIQSDWQRERFKEMGHNFAGIDGTHNTTQ
ncbi:hypothetical protein AURDEDRAFT_131761 [Auricularia subglabra TFB-10046 SS5]|uniref:FAR1 domain-containing protein n=1 Tax=Auricularia subglabra (strain TFB-10046 / SS5) TaxID=717982 RepID=J0WN85_AURST|nr:hypothetical protein AURDEDRAFT_131761 [Auricularia subglabra TFB-10046 SS5]